MFSSFSNIEEEGTYSNQCSKNQEYWKAIVEMNGLSINVLTKTQSRILSMIDRIEDPEIKVKLINICLKQDQKNSEPSHEPMNIPNMYYNIQEVFRRIESPAKLITLPDLQKEINNLKNEVKQLKHSIQ